MFAEHQPVIADWASESPERTAHVIKFVLTTIRCKFEDVPQRLTNALHGNIRTLHPAARLGFAYVDTNDMTLDNPETQPDEALLEHYLQIPGLGIVKSGFVVQLLYGRAGCLDTHNLRIYGLNANTFNCPPKIAALRKRLALYTQTIKLCGGTEALWNRWCTEIHRLRPTKWGSPYAVSRAHINIIIGSYEGE
jgi:hypothetical protein